ncbi:MAG: SEC-C metal-binding domain-containing protein [Acetobacteraceae bacterium]
MAKIGRNDRCPCGSGKKYKHCCMAQDEAAAHQKLAASATAAATAHHDPHLCDDCNEQLDAAANAVLALIDAGKLAEAEQAAHEVLARFPAVHDGYECLGRLYQAKGDNRQAADCYRRVIAFARNEPQLYDPHFIDHFQDLIDHLESQAAAD